MTLSFTIHGHPQPQGSTKSFVPKGWKRAIITSDNKSLKPWRQDVSGQAVAAMAGDPPTQGAVVVEASFYFAKPKSTPKRIEHKTTKPDVDKLLRGILDSLTGIVFVDDAQVVTAVSNKRFGTPERAEIAVREVVAEGNF